MAIMHKQIVVLRIYQMSDFMSDTMASLMVTYEYTNTNERFKFKEQKKDK
jgi:hypothetical protein